MELEVAVMTIDRGRQYTSLYMRSRQVLPANRDRMRGDKFGTEGHSTLLQSTCHKSPVLNTLVDASATGPISSFIIEGSRDVREVKHPIIRFLLSSLMMKMNWCIKYAAAICVKCSGFGLVFRREKG